MRAPTRLLVLVPLVVGLVGCGGNGSAGKAQPVPTSGAQLQSRLLTAGDIGAGWQVGSPINPQDRAAFAQIPCEGRSLDPAVAKRLTAVTGIQFEPTDRSYKHVIELVAIGDANQLDQDLRALFTTIESCAGQSSTLVVSKLAIPTLGDQRAAYSYLQGGASGASTRILVRAAFVRLGQVAVVLGLADFQASANGQSRVSDATYVQLLRTAITKLST